MSSVVPLFLVLCVALDHDWHREVALGDKPGQALQSGARLGCDFNFRLVRLGAPQNPRQLINAVGLMERRRSHGQELLDRRLLLQRGRAGTIGRASEAHGMAWRRSKGM